MKTKLLLLFIIIAGLSSCSTSYKLTQTPDDVYYSPVRERADYVKTDSNADKNIYTNNDGYRIDTRIHSRRWRYDRYDDRYNYPYGYNNPQVYVDPKNPSPANTSAPRKYNLGVYKNTNPVVDPKTGKPIITNNSSSTTPANNGSAVGNFIRKVFSGSNNNNNYHNPNDNSNNSSNRTYGPRTSNSSNNSSNSSGSSSSGSSSSGSSGSAPVRHF